MAGDMNDDMIMDLDLNQEPLVEPPPLFPSFGHGPLSNELETARGRIEDRIRQLEAVTARARQRQRWRQARNNPELSYMTVMEADGGLGNQNPVSTDIGDAVRVQDGVEESGGGERGRNSKRDISQLAKALEMDLDSKKTDNDGTGDGDDDSGGFFDCNICLEMARDPILTCCGHLFCWCCFYQLSYVDSTAKECPVCKGEVTDTSITPIYGNGKNQPVLKLESGVKIPPRPRGRRVESIRQQRVIRGISHVPVAEALRRIRIGIGSIGENPVFQGLNSAGPVSETSPSLLHSLEAGGSSRHRSRRFSRVISESAASLSSISSALNNAERLVEDLETYINDRFLRRTEAHILPSNQELNALLGTSSEPQPEPQNAEINPSLPVSSSSQRSVATTVVHLDNISTDSSVEIDLTISQSHPSSSSRRSAASRALSSEGGTSRELRRRRLR
ncbi:hypothetical protein L1987_39386 [Smallanthus sonchifolius]|uniref:Uncharacterized protein n=1 Tax=Smallanthus sonchifolius TaxID=185202 RepID=A0ACB9HPF0_9ASTR|nr:hypothetical protein L1987_39386 [Smallanthus sonchifolius]